MRISSSVGELQGQSFIRDCAHFIGSRQERAHDGVCRSRRRHAARNSAPRPQSLAGHQHRLELEKSELEKQRCDLPRVAAAYHGETVPLDGQAVYGEVSAAYNSRVQEYKRKLVQLRADAAAITTASARLMHEERHSLEPHEKSKIGQNCKTTARQRKWSFFV